MHLNGQKLKVLIVFGTRPDTIKLSPLMKLLTEDSAFDVLLCDTGQHDSTITGAILKFFDVHGKLVHLDTMVPDQSLNHVAQHVVAKIDDVIVMFRPDIMVVQGDTTSALAAAIAGFNREVPVTHVEAGLRTGSLTDPYPEEMNRIVIDRLSSMLFVPTPSAMSNLEVELMAPVSKVVVGNTSVDALRYCLDKMTKIQFVPFGTFYNKAVKHVLVTVHRRESFGEPLKRIVNAVIEIAKIYPDTRFVWPIHPNPNIKDAVLLKIANHSNIVSCDPLDYMTTVFMIRTAFAVITDSGGVQEEATSFAVPAVICRNVTDRTAHDEIATSNAASFDHTLLFNGRYVLSGTSTERIVEAFGKISKAIDKKKRRIVPQEMRSKIYPVYGDGLASKRIITLIKKQFDMVPNDFHDLLVFSYDNWKSF